MDPNAARCHLAVQVGCDHTDTDDSRFTAQVSRITSGHGTDAVLVTAATKGNEPVVLAGEVARKKATVVAVGAVGTEVPRSTYYAKELTFRISRSYGPGRYDPAYEEKGQDYPLSYVRWTENRNMQAFAQQVAAGRIDVKPLISHRFDIEKAHMAYDLITGKTGEPFLGVVLTYPGGVNPSRRLEFSPAMRSAPQRSPVTGLPSPVRVGFLGAGQFALSTLLPVMRKVSGLEFIGVCNATGTGAHHVARKFGFHYCTTNENEILSDPNINTVVIATRHHLHGRQVIEALNAGKHVFVEKPLCLNEGELEKIATVFNQLDQSNKSDQSKSMNQVLMVGYNRRFAPMARRLKSFLGETEEPLVMHYRVNAGYIPLDHWTQDPEEGGGRVLGEVCHFVDFLIFLAGARPTRLYARALSNNGRYRDDNLVATIEFSNGSLGTITYVANGAKAFPKEYIEVFRGGRAAVLYNFRKLELTQEDRREMVRSRFRQDKGHRGEWEVFVDTLRHRASSPIGFDEIVASTSASLCIKEALKRDGPVGIPLEGF
jgi:predicted dehydrogenase